MLLIKTIELERKAWQHSGMRLAGRREARLIDIPEIFAVQVAKGIRHVGAAQHEAVARPRFQDIKEGLEKDVRAVLHKLSQTMELLGALCGSGEYASAILSLALGKELLPPL